MFTDSFQSLQLVFPSETHGGKVQRMTHEKAFWHGTRSGLLQLWLTPTSAASFYHTWISMSHIDLPGGLYLNLSHIGKTWLSATASLWFYLFAQHVGGRPRHCSACNVHVTAEPPLSKSVFFYLLSPSRCLRLQLQSQPLGAVWSALFRHVLVTWSCWMSNIHIQTRWYVVIVRTVKLGYTLNSTTH